LVALAACAAVASAAGAAPPAFHTDACPVKLNGVRLGTDLTPAGSSLRNTFAYEPLTRRYHFWGFAADDADFPSIASTLRAVVHATSTDGLHFDSDSNLSYAFGSTSYATYGATIDPPLDFFRAVYDTDTGTWKLFAWTENVGASAGQYNYNTSVNDLGTTANTTAVLHQGPLLSPYAGNHVGAFGLVDNTLYLRVDSASGGNGQLAYTDAIPPSTGALLAEADLYAGTPYCWFLQASCGSSDPRIPAYVHNVGRTLRQVDGTLATYYGFRDATTYARLDKQVWFVASTDDGANWSVPAGVFADGGALTIDRQATAADGNFGNVDSVQAPNVCRMYFGTRDAQGRSVVVSATTGSGCDALFADGFDGCGD
jgi:hypothetical protein